MHHLPLTEEPRRFVATELKSNRSPKGVIAVRKLGKGKNNKTSVVQWKDGTFVLRCPRRKSDTEMHGSAEWECMQTMHASQLGAGPLVFAAWFRKHAAKSSSALKPSGLYMIMERFDLDLDKFLLCDKRRYDEGTMDMIAGCVADCLATLSGGDMFLFDLKPQNIVLSFPPDGRPRARIIDFGRDFCEWKGGDSREDVKTPVIDMVRRLCSSPEEVRHVLFSSMLVQFAAVTTYLLQTARHETRDCSSTRKRINAFARLTEKHLDNMRAMHINVVRKVLRQDDVKGVLKHYNGRRNAGTGRTLRLARGVEM